LTVTILIRLYAYLNLQKYNYNECASFICVVPPVELPAMGLLSVENFSETKLS